MARAASRRSRPPAQFSESAMAALMAHRWPGNVRETENAIERAMLMATGDCSAVEDLPADLVPSEDEAMPLEPGGDLSIKRHTAALEALLIRRALSTTGGNRSQSRPTPGHLVQGARLQDPRLRLGGAMKLLCSLFSVWDAPRIITPDGVQSSLDGHGRGRREALSRSARSGPNHVGALSGLGWVYLPRGTA